MDAFKTVAKVTEIECKDGAKPASGKVFPFCNS
jgi:hypothetical protein